MDIIVINLWLNKTIIVKCITYVISQHCEIDGFLKKDYMLMHSCDENLKYIVGYFTNHEQKIKYQSRSNQFSVWQNVELL